MRQKYLRIAATAVALLIGQTLFGQAKNPEWKDRAEYDLYDAIQKDPNAQTRIEKLDKWKKDYPETQFITYRRLYYLGTYQELNKPAEVFTAAKEILAADANNMQALVALCAYVRRFQPAPSADDMATAEKAAGQLVSGIDTFFAADKKPANVPDDKWKAARKDVLLLGQNTLGWIPMIRKENEKAEVELTKSLAIEPNSGEVTYWLASVILGQGKLEKRPLALYHFARAAHYDGPGALAAEGRKTVVPYFEKLYKGYHGEDPEGMAKVVEMAKASALPPADFKIKSIIEIDKENEVAEEENAKKFPDKALWKDLKTALTGDGGQSYFDSGMKGAALPGGIEKAGQKVTKFRGRLVSATPETNPKELVLSISGGSGDVTLKLDAPLKGKMENGVDLTFSGVASSYSKEPFMVIFDVERADVGDWAGVGGTVVAAPATKKAPAAKPAAGAKPAPRPVVKKK